MIGVKNVSIDDFTKRETRLSRGLAIFLAHSFSSYLTTEQLKALAQAFHKVRMRPADASIDALDIPSISMSREIRDLMIPAKQIRRDEAAYVIYKLAPYALMSRKETAVFAKKLFPEFFGSVATINTIFTRLEGVPDGLSNIQVYDVPKHTTVCVEEVLSNLVSVSL